MKILRLLLLSGLAFFLLYDSASAGDDNNSSEITITPPANLTASKGKYADKLSLKWDAVPGAEMYYIYRSLSEEGTYDETGNSASTFHDDLKAEPGVLYYYRIKAGFPGGKISELSAAANGFLKLAAPVISVSDTEPDKLIITWEKVRGAEKYYIYRSDSTDDYRETGIAESARYEDKTVPGKTYYYKIKAFSGLAQFSDFSNNVSAVTKLSPPVITASSDSISAVIVKWTAVQGADEFFLYRSESGIENYEIIKSTKSEGYEDSSVKPGRMFNYKVRSHADKTGFSEFSNTASGCIKLAGPEPAVSGNIIGKMKLEWKAVQGAEKYYVYRSASASGSYEEIARTDNTVYIDENIDPDKNYYYKVTAWSEAGFGIESRVLQGQSEKTSKGLYARAIFPGWGQYYSGRHTAGIAYAAGFAFCAAMTGLSFYLREAAWKEYSDLPYGTSESTFDAKYNNYRYAAYSVWGFAGLTAVIYILNWADVLYFNNSAMGVPGADNRTADSRFNMLGFYLYRDEEFCENRVGMDFKVRF